MTGSRLLGLIRAVPYVVFTLVMMPIQGVLVALGVPAMQRLPRWYHARALRMLGVEILVRGAPSQTHPTLFVSNHTSYFDIPVLGSLIEVSFIAKADMIDWPFFGKLAKLQRSVFVDRKPRNVGDHANDIADRLAAGDSLVLFAEGTTSDGNRLLPFKSALFSVAEQASPDKPLAIQPVSVVATALDGMPLGRELRPIYSWFGDMPLASHAWQAICLGRLRVEVEFHPAFAANGIARKALAERCYQSVEQGFARAVCGRSGETLPANRAPAVEDGEAVEAAA